MTMDSIHALVPLLCVMAAAIAAMVAEAFRKPGESMPIAPLGLIGLVGAGAATFLLWGHNAGSFGVVQADNFALFIVGTLVVVGLLSVAVGSTSVARLGLPVGEYYALLLFSLGGMMLMAMATDLIVIFLALEVMSLAIYVLTGIRRDSPVAIEAAFKYFLLGAFASAFLLYGIAFTYGIAGSTRLDRVASLFASAATAPEPLHLAAIGLLLIGFAFKVSAVPFHMWTPDAYEGASPAVTGFMSTGVKAAAFAAFARVFLTAFEPLHPEWSVVVWGLAAMTMVVATLIGVAQTSVKRMLAYSSVAHGGYLLVAMVADNGIAKGAILFYLLTYAVTNIGAFGIISLLETSERPFDQVGDYAGLGSERPFLAFLLTVFLLSLGGFPPFGGFIAKWYIFTGAIAAGYTWLAIIGVLMSVVSVYFYMRLVVKMYMTPSNGPVAVPVVPVAAGLALVASAIAVLYLGVLPTHVLTWAAASVETLF